MYSLDQLNAIVNEMGGSIGQSGKSGPGIDRWELELRLPKIKINFTGTKAVACQKLEGYLMDNHGAYLQNAAYAIKRNGAFFA